MFSLKINTKLEYSQEFEFLIIGGGITGLAIARELAERGHSVGLIEKKDFYCATSSATSKLIHGGLRYLENFEVGLVRESLKERRILMLSASHLVKPIPFVIPVLPWTKPNPGLIYLGLKLYDVLSFDRNQFVPDEYYIPPARRISKQEINNLLPEILSIPAEGGLLYYDCLSLHPERLALAFLKSAFQKGAKFYNYVEIQNIVTENNNGKIKIQELELKDKITGKTARFKAKVFINATGPWMDIVLSKILNKEIKKLARSKGIHLLTRPILSNKVAVLFRTKSHRHFFVIPWMGLSLIGPTDTPFLDDPDKLKPEKSDIEQLIHDFNETVPGDLLSKDMILDVPVGIRPLISSDPKNTYKTSRKYEIFTHEENLQNFITVAGGKWTTSRKLGEDVVKEIYKKYPEFQSNVKVDTSQLPLFGSPGYSNPYSVYENFALKEFRIEEINKEQHKHLMGLYGTEHVEILQLIRKNPKLAEPISNTLRQREVLAQVEFSIIYEGARTLEDIVKRRMAVGTYGVPDRKSLEKITKHAAKILK